MLDLNTRFELFGVTLYRDADDPGVFFYLPVNPTIPRDAAGLMFDLMVYEKGGEGSDIQGGGFLTLAVATGLGRLEGPLLAELKKRFGAGVRLASVPFTGGSVRLAGLDTGVAPVTEAGTGAASDAGPAGIRLVERVFGTATPNLDGDNRAVFSLTLSMDGAAFFLDLLENGRSARPLIAIYDLTYVGLMEVESLRIRIDYARAYDFLRTRIGFNAVVVAGEIDTILEDLKDRQAIRIEDTVRTLELSTPEAMKERQTRIDALVKDLATGALFAPSLTLGDPAVDEAQVFSAVPADGAGGLFRRGVPAAVGQVMATAATQAQGDDTASGMPPADPGEGTAPQAPASGTEVARVNRDLGTPRATFTMRRLQQRELREVTYDLSRTTAIQKSTGPQNPLLMMAAPLEMANRIHRISLNHPFFQRLRIDVDAGGTDFAAEGVREMTVNLRYGRRADGRPRETADAVLRSAADRTSFVFARDAAAGGRYEYRLTVHYLPGFGFGDRQNSVTGPWTPSEARTLALTPALVARREAVRLTLPRNLPADLAEVRATLVYDDAEHLVEDRRAVILTSEAREARVDVRFADGNDRLRILVEAVFEDGRTQPMPEEVRPDPAGGKPMNLVVLPVPVRPAVRFVAMLSDPLDEIRSVILDYTVRQGGAVVGSGAVELTEALQGVPVTVTLPAAAPLPEVRVTERRLFNSGGIQTLPPRVLTDLMVITGLPAEDVMQVTARYQGPPFDTLGALGMLVELTYGAGDPEFAQYTTLFVENREAQQWTVRLKDRRDRRFTHRTTLLLADGSERRGEPVTTDSPLIILRIAG